MGPRPPLVHLTLALACLIELAPTIAAEAQGVDREALETAVAAYDRDAIESIGSDAMPVLVEMYQEADVSDRARIATVFYQLGWKSEAARRAMMEDIDSSDETLLIRVQWALGRVSNDDTVVDALLDKMLNGSSALVRDKAGCGLAYDQIHLTERQKASLYRRLIARLEHPSAEQRSLAIRVLKEHTGQTKGFHPIVRKPETVDRWKRWIDEFDASLEG